MSDHEHVAVAAVSDAAEDAAARAGTRVRLPVGRLLTGRGLVAGSAADAPAATARLVADRLLSNGHGVVLLDRTGSFGDLAGAPEVLHCGSGPHADLTATPDDAESLVGMALERRLPVLVDLSSLPAAAADATTAAVARALPSEAGPDTDPVLLLVDGVHELLPAADEAGDAGEALSELARHGPDLGLGVCGVTSQPGDLDHDFVSLSDWAAWHRLDDRADRDPFARDVGSHYRETASTLDPDEALLVTEWTDDVTWVTVDEFEPRHPDGIYPDPGANATEGDGELGDLIADGPSPERATVADLRAELADIDARLDDIEARVAATRDLDELADRLAEALTAAGQGHSGSDAAQPGQDGAAGTDAEFTQLDPHPDWPAWPGEREGEGRENTVPAADADVEPEPGSETSAESDASAAFEAFAAMDDDATGGEDAGVAANGTESRGQAEAAGSSDDDVAEAFEWHGDEGEEADPAPPEGTVAADVENALDRESADRDGEARREREAAVRKPGFVRRLVRDVRSLEPPARAMLAHYVEAGPSTPIAAHLNATGSEDRNLAYAHNRSLRSNGLIRHVGRGQYVSCLEQLLADAADEDLEPEALERYAGHVAERAIAE